MPLGNCRILRLIFESPGLTAIIAGVAVRVSSPQFVGRGEELRALEEALARATDGAGSVTLIAAEAGMGKSRLIAEFAVAARATGATVLIGECPPLGEGELPYAPIAGALRSLGQDHGGDEIDTLAGPARDQSRLFEQLLAVFVSAAQEAPLVLVIEDLHWSDRSTRDFLAFLVGATRHERLMLVVSYRSDEVQRRHPARQFVVELERSGQAVRLDLSRFTRAEIRAQVQGIRDAIPEPELVDRLLERGEGNPFFTEELLVWADAPGAGLPESLRDALLLRVDERSGDVQAALRVAAVAGRDADHALLEAVAGLSPDALTVALREAVDSHLLVHDAGSTRYAFRHALLREAIYADLLPGERQSLHLTLARALRDHPELAGADATAAAELAHHWYAAGELPEALAASIEAAIEAERVHALGEALLHYERALEIWDRAGPPARELPLHRIDVMRRAAAVANLTGDNERAIALARAAIERLDAGDLVAIALLHERLGRYLWLAGRGEDALPEYRRATALMPASPPSAELALVLAAEAQALMLCDHTAESATLCEQALAIAREVQAPEVEAHVLNTMCANLSSSGQPERAVEAGAHARRIARDCGAIEEVLRGHINGGEALDQAGRVPDAIALAWEGVQLAGTLGTERMYGDHLRSQIMWRLLQTGRWEEAQELLDDVVERAPAGVPAGATYGQAAQLYAHRGAFDAARRALELAEPHIRRSGGSMWVALLAESKATIELWDGRPDHAAETVDACLAALEGTETVFSTVRLYELGARACADIAVRAPDDDQVQRSQVAIADALLGRLDELMGELVSASPRTAASRQTCAAERARVVDDGGGHDEWAAARRLWEASGDPFLAAYAGWRQAEAILTSGDDRRAAQALVRDAHYAAASLGAQPLCNELEALARRARLDLGPQDGTPTAPHALLDELELTPRELEVLALLGDGMTNREIAAELFISDKTASVHVSRILAKLSVPNRAAAAAAAQRLGVRRISA